MALKRAHLGLLTELKLYTDKIDAIQRVGDGLECVGCAVPPPVMYTSVCHTSRCLWTLVRWGLRAETLGEAAATANSDDAGDGGDNQETGAQPPDSQRASAPTGMEQRQQRLLQIVRSVLDAVREAEADRAALAAGAGGAPR